MTRNVLQPGEFMLKVTLPDDVSDWTGLSKTQAMDTGISRAGAAAAWRKGDRSIESCYHCIGKHSRRHDTEVAESDGDVKSICDAVYKSTKPVNNTSYLQDIEET